ncbi:MAG: serine hydrolase [Gemmatimonadota bacterium]|nr:serine hydrolase [Gemmatimonadota bacterium]
MFRRLAIICSLVVAFSAGAQETVAPRANYAAVAAAIERLIEHERADKKLPALSIALVDGQDIVWARGFGFANPKDSTPATAQTIYRVGSVSKLFTDIGIMQLVERGAINLDAPIATYLPDFHPRNPFGKTITLRQMMSHRAGLVREPPAGNYFEPNGGTLAGMVASLNATTLVYPPEAKTKYSNAAIGTVGYVLEKTQHEPFARYLKRSVLDQLGLRSSSFEPSADLMPRLASAFMWTMDGHGTTDEIPFLAPTFQLGMSPAGSMYSTVTDLGRFMSVLFDGGGRVLKRETLEKMWTPQYAAAGARTGYGIGFGIDTLGSHRRIGHGGAIYGFATELEALPDDKLGVAVVTTMDGANTVSTRIADAALRLMLAAREGGTVAAQPLTSTVPAARAHALAGHYENGTKYVDLITEWDELRLRTEDGAMLSLRALGDTILVDDRLGYGPRLTFLGDRITIGGDTLARAVAAKPAPPPARWLGLIGEYGWDHDVLFIHERNGQLYALIEWFFSYPLKEIKPNVFAFPEDGLYAGEKLFFRTDAKGRGTGVVAANVMFKRRSVGPESGNQLRITPLRPVAELRKEAMVATPPEERDCLRAPDLVELTALDPTIKLEIRYATSHNFLGTPFYSQARAFMQRPAAEAVVRVHRKLKEQGFGLLIHDAYRPWFVTKMFWDATPDSKKIFVANPASGSRHNRGEAVDLTLYDLKTGKPIEMVGTYDETTGRSYPDYPGGTALQRWHRDLLRNAMEADGFTVFAEEWWHFDYKDWREYPIGNVAFDKLGVR